MARILYIETAPQKRWDLLQDAIESGKMDQEEAALREKTMEAQI